MTPNEIVAAVSAAHRARVTDVLGTTRTPRLVRTRVEIANRLMLARYTIDVIANALRKDRTTILYYLGNRKDQLRPARRKSREQDRYERKKAGVRYLVPYAGADMKEYQWKEREAAT